MEKNTISINKKIAEKQKNIEVKGDIIVPDTKPDIVNIINSNAIPYIYKEECSDGKYRFDGNLDTHIIYLSDNGETKSMQTTLDFMDFIEDSRITDNNITSKYRIEICNIETKVLNERKVSLCVNLKICFSFFEKENIEYIGDLNTLNGVEKLEETIQFESLMSSNKIKTSLKEDVSVDEMDDIIDILKSEILIGNIENKVSYNKVLSKADVNIKIIYMTENSKIGVVNANVPIMNFIDMENVSDEDICKIDYKVRNMLFKPNSKEMKSISCQIDFEVCCEVYKNETITIVQDMYGIDKNISFNQKNVEIQVGDSSKEVVNINENILVEDVRSLYDVDCSATILNKVPNGRYCNYEGEVCVNIYFETGNNLGVKQTKLPFMVKLEGDSDDIQIEFLKKQFRLNNEDVNCSIDMEVKSNSSNYKTVNIIEDVKEEESDIQNDYAMIVYFVKQGDTIWNIARDFRVSLENLRRVNNLSETDKVNVGEKLYIMR